MKNTQYYLAALTAYAIWGFFSLILRPIHAYPSLDILFYRVFLCAVLMLFIVLFFKRTQLKSNIALFKALPAGGKRKAALFNIGGGALLTANWFSFIYVMNHISVKATSLAYLVCPILTTLLAYFLLKEKLNKLQWLAVALSVAGCLLLSYARLMDMAFSLIIGFTYALYLVAQKVNAGFDKFIILTFQIVVSAILLLPFYPAYSSPLPESFSFYGYVAIIAVAFTIIPSLLNLYALKGIDTSTAGMLINVNPLIAFVLATVVFMEPMDTMQIVAYSTIFIAVVVFNARFIFNRKRT
ncbi:MAG: EamA family transporter [Taibaiella sp.]